MAEQQEDRISRVARGVRFDLVIAMCALLISTLAAGASWWQARIVQNQTLILQEQLGAQVWPYVSLSENISGDRAELSTTNDGLGPAVLRSATALVDGVPRSNFIEILHAILGPNLVARKPHGQRMSIDIGSASPGTVLRPDRSTLDFVLISKRFAPPFIQGAATRLRFRICYCAIVPGRCWLSDSQSNRDPQSVPACQEIPNDLLHASAVQQLFSRKF
jgi:hypothetical protein